MDRMDYVSSSNRMVAPLWVTQAASGEKIEFCVKATRAVPLVAPMSLLGFATIWLAITGTISAMFFLPLLKGEQVHFKKNGIPVVAGPDNIAELLMPGLILGLFLIIGIAIVGFALRMLFKEGSWFVGTPKRLIVISKNELKSLDWEQFNGVIEARGSETSGNINLQLRTGKYRHRKHGPDQYVADSIDMVGISNAYNIHEMCRKRIKENDPTP